ncbi:MAG: hypothetical protein ACJ74G_23850 [Blastocatellia bacterium]
MPFDNADKRVDGVLHLLHILSRLFALLDERGNLLAVFFLLLVDPIKPLIMVVKPLIMTAGHLALEADHLHQRGDLFAIFFAARILDAPRFDELGYRFLKVRLRLDDGLNLVVDSPLEIVTAHFSLFNSACSAIV